MSRSSSTGQESPHLVGYPLVASTPLPSPYPAPHVLRQFIDGISAKANRPDENLGQSTVGPSLCRIRNSSARALAARFCSLHPVRTPHTFVDLGCGRGLVCATMLAEIPWLHQVIGWDICDREIQWACANLNADVYHLPLLKMLEFHTENAVAFNLERDLKRQPNTEIYNVWIYAFWKDWSVTDRRRIARRLFLEQSHLWTVFACSDRKRVLFEEVIADGDETTIELLRDGFDEVSAVPVQLMGSGEQHTIYMYRRRI